jgi:hypothetical protein
MVIDAEANPDHDDIQAIIVDLSRKILERLTVSQH